MTGTVPTAAAAETQCVPHDRNAKHAHSAAIKPQSLVTGLLLLTCVLALSFVPTKDERAAVEAAAALVEQTTRVPTVEGTVPVASTPKPTRAPLKATKGWRGIFGGGGDAAAPTTTKAVAVRTAGPRRKRPEADAPLPSVEADSWWHDEGDAPPLCPKVECWHDAGACGHPLQPCVDALTRQTIPHASIVSAASQQANGTTAAPSSAADGATDAPTAATPTTAPVAPYCVCPAAQCMLFNGACVVSPYWVGRDTADAPPPGRCVVPPETRLLEEDRGAAAPSSPPRQPAAKKKHAVPDASAQREESIPEQTPAPPPTLVQPLPLHPQLIAGSEWLFRGHGTGFDAAAFSNRSAASETPARATTAAPPVETTPVPAAIVPPPETPTPQQGDGPYTVGAPGGSFDMHKGIFELQNVCFQPRGPLVVPVGPGIAPFAGISGYRGEHELEREIKHTMNEFHGWVASPWQVRVASADAIEWREEPGVLVVVGAKADNIKHVFHRAASALSILRDEVGPDYRANVTAIYAADQIAITEIKSTARNAYRRFRPLLTHRWFGINMTAGPERGGSPPVDAGKMDRTSPVACFRRVIVPHTCWVRCNLRNSRGTMVNGKRVTYPDPNRYALTWTGGRRPTDVMLQLRLAQATAGCFGATLRTVADTKSPRLLIVWRSRIRKFVFFGPAMDVIARYARSRGFRAVHVVEHTRVTAAVNARLFANADVVIGAIGAGLTWSYLMPKGAVLQELNYRFGCAWGKGYGWGQSSMCDYGGTAAVAGTHHLSIKLGLPCIERDVHGAFFVSTEFWKRLIDTALCRLRDEPSETTTPLPTSADGPTAPTVATRTPPPTTPAPPGLPEVTPEDLAQCLPGAPGAYCYDGWPQKQAEPLAFGQPTLRP